MTSAPLDPEHRRDLEGLAAFAITAAEMGGTDQDVRATVVDYAARLGRLTRDDLVLIAEAIRQLPQPLDESADERQRRRPIEEMLGVTSPEDQFAAQLRAREVVLALAGELDG